MITVVAVLGVLVLLIGVGLGAQHRRREEWLDRIAGSAPASEETPYARSAREGHTESLADFEDRIIPKDDQ